jgi:hypothetical protein
VSIVAPRSASYPAVMASWAPRRSTLSHVALVKSAPSVQPGKRTEVSLAAPKSASRSRQFSNVTSVSVPSRKLTESSLQSRKVTRRSCALNACTPDSAQPVTAVSSQAVSARSVATNRVSRSVLSVNRHFRILFSPNVLWSNVQSRK